MATFIEETLFVDSVSYKDEMIQFGLEDQVHFYIKNDKEDAEAIYLTFTYEDWVIIKSFIDEQFKKNKIPF